MIHKKVRLANKLADGYEIPLAAINLVFVTTDKGVVGCGAFDVMALDAFNCPAARVKSESGKPIATIDDLLEGTVKESNTSAIKLGIGIGISGRKALEML